MPPAGTAASAWLAVPFAFVVSAATTWIAIGYARRRSLLDLPGARRSHTTPTPRGGGIGIVVAVLACACAPALIAGPDDARLDMSVIASAILIVALVGWIDDHRGLPAWTRFFAHCVAAGVLVTPSIATAIEQWPLLRALGGTGATELFTIACCGVLAIAVATVWSINLHNFMDGIDGLLAAQAIFVFTALAILLGAKGNDPRAAVIATFAAATLGFLPFNFPRARIFMGDVGSGVLGLLVAVAAIMQLGTLRAALASSAILVSAFVIDATCTLISRIVRGRRWYSAHREHLYQWLTRSGFSHAGVVAIYMGWNLVVAVPVVAWINWSPTPMTTESDAFPRFGVSEATAVYLIGAAVWILGKRRCLAAARERSRHAAP